MPAIPAVQLTLLLASSSPRRQELIKFLGVPYEIKVSHADETTEPGLAPYQIVETLSMRKAEAVYQSLAQEERTGYVIVGSDTIVVLDGEVLGKPRDKADAIRMLSGLQGRSHTVYSGVACLAGTGGRRQATGSYDNTIHLGDIGRYRIISESIDGQPELIVGHTASKVTFRPMNDREIEAYVKTGEPLDKAGSYGVQGIGAVFVEKIEGDFYSVMGLPLNLLYQMLLQFGINPFK